MNDDVHATATEFKGWLLLLFGSRHMAIQPHRNVAPLRQNVATLTHFIGPPITTCGAAPLRQSVATLTRLKRWQAREESPPLRGADPASPHFPALEAETITRCRAFAYKARHLVLVARAAPSDSLTRLSHRGKWQKPGLHSGGPGFCRRAEGHCRSLGRRPQQSLSGGLGQHMRSS